MNEEYNVIQGKPQSAPASVLENKKLQELWEAQLDGVRSQIATCETDLSELRRAERALKSALNGLIDEPKMKLTGGGVIGATEAVNSARY